MTFVAGISLSGLAAGSILSLWVLSVQDSSYSLSLEEIIEPAATVQQVLQSAFERLSKSLSQKLEQVVFTIPIYFTDSEREAVYSAAKLAGWMVPRKLSGILDHVQTYHRSSVQENYTTQNELVLDIGSSASSSRLVSTEVEENIRMSDVVTQYFVREAPTDVDELLSKLVDPAFVDLQASPSSAGPTLTCIVVIDSSTTIVPRLIEQLRSRFSNSSVKIVLAPNPSQHAARLALVKQNDLLADKLVFNTAVLRIGIAKSDGFVLTLLPYNFTLPNHRSAILTTSKDDQTKVTVQIVAGVSPHARDNTVVAELVLVGLSKRPRGTTLIQVTLDVDEMGATKILAEEVTVNGECGIKETVELKSLTGNMTEDDIEAYWNSGKSEEVLIEQAARAEDLWAGEMAQGDLPE